MATSDLIRAIRLGSLFAAISFILLHFLLDPFSQFEFWSTLTIILFGFVPTFAATRFSRSTFEHIFIINSVLFLGCLFYFEPFVDYFIFAFMPLASLFIRSTVQLLYGFILTIVAYCTVVYLHPNMYFNLVEDLHRLSLFLGLSGMLYLILHSYMKSMKTNSLYTKTMDALIIAIEAKDPYTKGHSHRVSQYSMLLGELLLNAGHSIDLQLLKVSSLLHDIGKVHVPIHILTKTGKLTAEEYELVKLHSSYGATIVKSLGFEGNIVKIIRHHHERVDGKGYPDQLTNLEIPFYSKIIAVADTFDALTSDRSYREAFSFLKAKEIIKEVKGTQLDPIIVDIFLENFAQFTKELEADRYQVNAETVQKKEDVFI